MPNNNKLYIWEVHNMGVWVTWLMFRTSRLIEAKVKPLSSIVENAIIFVYQYPQTQMNVSIKAANLANSSPVILLSEFVAHKTILGRCRVVLCICKLLPHLNIASGTVWANKDLLKYWPRDSRSLEQNWMLENWSSSIKGIAEISCLNSWILPCFILFQIYHSV